MANLLLSFTLNDFYLTDLSLEPILNQFFVCQAIERAQQKHQQTGSLIFSS